LGHASRCIPIIHALVKLNFEPILASDGDALLLLQKEFPLLKSYTLPSYNIKYSKSGKNLKFKLFLSVPSIFLAVKKEQKFISQLIEKENIKGVISDNRFGVFSKKIPSIYITHQLLVLSGKTTNLTSIIHQKIIKKFDECWVPDFKNEPNLSGDLGHLKVAGFNLKYIGVLSRLKFKTAKIKYNLLVLLSGPEPQRTLLENKLLRELKNYQGNTLFVRGILSNTSSINTSNKNMKIVDYLLTESLEKAMNQSEMVICRSGYSTIMDLATLGKKAYFIPTSGQYEQEYLAKKLQEEKIAPYSEQENFYLEKLDEIQKYKGFSTFETKLDLELLKLFEGK